MPTLSPEGKINMVNAILGFPWWISGRLRALLNSTAPEHILSMQLHTFCLDKRQRLFPEEFL